MIEFILIANRGEIACRIINTARNMGIRTVAAIASGEDRDARHGRMADQLIPLDDGPASQNYLNISAIIEAAKHSRAQAIHPDMVFCPKVQSGICRCCASGRYPLYWPVC